MISLSTALYSAMASQLAGAFSGGFIRIFAGARPANASDAETGVLLGVVTANGVTGAGLHFQASPEGIYNVPYETLVFEGLATGTATWFRVVGPDDTGEASTTEQRIDGSIGTFSMPGDMAWQTTAVTSGADYTIDSFRYIIHPLGPTP